MEAVTLDEGVTTYTLPAATFTAPANKAFSYWSKNGTYAGMVGETITVNADTTLTAAYGVERTIGLNPGTGDGAPIEGHAVDGQKYSLPTAEFVGFTPPYAGSRFLGWFIDTGQAAMEIDEIYQPGTTWAIDGEILFIALWEGDAFDVWMNRINGTGEDAVITYYTSGSASVDFTLPTGEELGWEAPEGYVEPLLTWYSDEACTQRVGAAGDEIELTADIELYGQWSET